MSKYILIEGNPVDGFAYTGPFDEHEDVVTEANTGSRDADWWIGKLLPTTVVIPDNNFPISTTLNAWCVARLSDSREGGEIDVDVSDAVIEREAEKLEILIHKITSSFVDNEFNEKE
jgi:hypothetical protein